VLQALETLREQTLTMESSGSRVARFGHNMERVLSVPSQSVALLAVLMLRGPQTAAELRANCERLHRFADVSAVEGFLEELSERPGGALVTLLPRQPGAREARWAHLLAGEPAVSSPAAPRTEYDTALADRVAALEQEVASLKAIVTDLRAALGE
jgi:uncharacterized protein YceH (UPF0502 family)